MNYNVLDTGFGGCPRYRIGHELSVAVHGTVNDHYSLFRPVTAPFVVKVDYMPRVGAEDRPVRRADDLQVESADLGYRLLRRRGVASDDIRKIAQRLIFIQRHIELVVEYPAFESAESAESVC